MASLQARHSRHCDIRRPWTTFIDATKERGCTCVPLYHIVLRHNGKLVREPVGHNRREAERALDARRGDLARRTYRVLQDVRFDEWADKWLGSFTGKRSSHRTYGHTMEYAKRAFGHVKVRDLGSGDVRRFLDVIRQANLDRRSAKRDPDDAPPLDASPATLAKHLRQLGACLQAAVIEGYATENPVRRLSKTARPKVPKNRPAYYTDSELAALWPKLACRPVMAHLCKIAVATGLRFGELAALRWSDVDLLNREVHVLRTFVDGIGEQPPKSNEPRTIDLTPQAAALLEEWYAATSAHSGELVFAREEGGYVTPKYVTSQVLYPALKRAGIPRVGERGRKRDFHSFRHTFARLALEGGAEITWVQKQLGHSSITLTVDTYGSWSRAAEKSQAARLVGAFPL
jgi:integrase